MPDRRTFLKASLIGLPLATAATAMEHPSNTSVFKMPVVVSTWDSGLRANAAAWEVMESGGRALDGVEAAARSAEDEPSCCVGLAALPDRDGFVTLDACIMDEKANCGAVSFVQNI